jgi:hypothetical protein
MASAVEPRLDHPLPAAIVVPYNQPNLAIEKGSEPPDVFTGPESEVAQVVDDVTRTHAIVPPSHHLPIHLRDVAEWSAAEADYIRV